MTTRILGSMAVACALSALAGLTGTSLSAQSLGELARKAEEQRKTLTTKGAVYTNDDLQPVARPAPSPDAQAAAPTASGQAATPPTQSGTAGSSDGASDDDEGAGSDRGEAYWRQRVQTEREALSRAETFAAALQSQINGLWAEFTACDAPPQCNKASEDRQKAIAELERVQGEIKTHTANITRIQEEARRANVPAGWVR